MPDAVAAAEASISKSDWKTAEAKLDSWLVSHPTDARALFDAGYVADIQNRLDDAVALYRRAISADPNSFEAHLSLGLLLARQGKPSEARPELLASTTLDPGTAGPELKARAWRALARIDRDSDAGQASADLIEALKLSPETPADTLLAAQLAEQYVPQPALPLDERRKTFECYEKVMTEAEARQEAQRCMNCGECSQCMECVSACAPKCIDFAQKPTSLSIDVGAVVVSTGFNILDPATKELFGYGRFPNVVSGPQMDRLLAPTRPYNAVLRPSDGKEPEKIAMILCVGSRDQTVCNPLCCRIGCMYSIKQAQLAMGALPMADITIYMIDIRAFGKGYDEFYEQSKAMGIEFVKGKVAQIEQVANGNLAVHYEDMLGEGGKKIREHDLVVLTVGFLPNTDVFSLYKGEKLAADDFGYVREIDPISEPTRTNVDGLYAAGTIIGAMDIPDTVLHSGAAAAQAAAYLERRRVR